MLPTAYEFHWDTGHIVFLGIFYSVLTVVMSTLIIASLRARRDMKKRRETDIAWRESSAELAPATPTDARLYHRGHTWVEARHDGTYDVGVDDLLRSCVGNPDRVTVPGVGTRLMAGTPVADLQRGHVHARIATPISGTVVAVGDYEGGRLYRLRPDDGKVRLDQLLRATEARVWMLRELEMLQARLTRPGEALALADGGELVGDLMGAYPDADWDAILADLCLEP